jgi:hypothetical protein
LKPSKPLLRSIYKFGILSLLRQILIYRESEQNHNTKEELKTSSFLSRVSKISCEIIMHFKSTIALSLAALAVVSASPASDLEARDKIKCKDNQKAVCKVKGVTLFTILSDLEALNCVNVLNGNQVCVAL